MENTALTDRDFNTISPSALSLLLMKGYTNIPFARQTAELIKYPEKYQPDFSKRDMTFWARTMHFENRYWSIDQLLENLQIKNILELSSGFSFRGLESTKQNDYYYIDTDLQDVITRKKEFVNALKDESYQAKGILELLALNALDEEQFNQLVARFPKGELVIVNEGLLMYLSTTEKEILCGIIYKILKNRGGYWITSDIYIQNMQDKLHLKIDNKTKEFFEQHKLEDNKFRSFEEAEKFFIQMGFTIDKVANVKISKLSSSKYLMKSMTLRQLFRLSKAGKIQETWRLKIADTN